MNVRRRVWEIVEVAKPGDKASRIFDISILSLIFLNVIAVIIGTVPSIEARYYESLEIFEVFSVIIFSVEYATRMWSCTVDPRYKGSIKGRLRFAMTGMAIIDLLAILPFYLPYCGIDLRSLRILRLFRLVRIGKVGRYYSSLGLIKRVFKAKKEELVLSTAMMLMLLVISSGVLYYCENSVQPDSFSSIPATMWWAVATLTTVGYGDMYPQTFLGKLCASIIAILGIAMFALPTAILGSGFVEEIQESKPGPSFCPHCGKKL